MTITYWPFDSGAGSGAYEEQLYQMYRLYRATGVIQEVDRSDIDGDRLEVYADGSGMQVKVPTGLAHMEGHMVKNDAELTLAIGAADATHPRIDRVIVYANRSTNVCGISILEGTAAASPSAPSLTQTSALWQMSLAQVYVTALVTSIAADKVTDERTFSSRSGGGAGAYSMGQAQMLGY